MKKILSVCAILLASIALPLCAESAVVLKAATPARALVIPVPMPEPSSFGLLTVDLLSAVGVVCLFRRGLRRTSR